MHRFEALNLRSARVRAEKLRTEINSARYAYHVEDRDSISADALDSLKHELAAIEEQFPELITPDSPTQRVAGKALERFTKVTHREPPMLSLNDVFSPDEVRAWGGRITKQLGGDVVRSWYCDLKMDGLAIELVYRDGLLVQGATRGDGRVGEDVTQNIRTIDAIPLRLRTGKQAIPKELTVRGEVFLTKREFARINREQETRGEKPFANPRNVAAGAIRQLDPQVTASRKLMFYAYSIVGSGSEYRELFPTHEAEYRALRAWGIATNPEGIVVKSFDDLFSFYKTIEKKREKLLYEIDGIVVSINEREYYERAGIVGKAPRGAIAYKFSPREATTIVRAIEVSVGRTGALTPVAVLDPVTIGGVTVTHASLHNADEIERLGLVIGDTVIVNRAGDVIPKITTVLSTLRTGKEKKFTFPSRCPIDASPVVRDGVIARCSNPRCGARLRESLYHFVSRAAFDIRGLGPKIIDRFLDAGLIVDAADIFSLCEGDIVALERFGAQSASNIVTEIAEKKSTTLTRLLFALGMPHVGEATAHTLAEAIAQQLGTKKQENANVSVRTCFAVLSAYTIEELQRMKDVGPIVATEVHGWMHDARNRELLSDIDRAGVTVTLPKTNGLFTGTAFVLTGALSSMDRATAKERICALGGTVTETVTKETTFLVAGERSGSKYMRARALHVAILDEQAFVTLLEGR